VEVADARAARKSLGPDARNYHSLLWLEYGYLQEGRKQDARRVLDDVARSAGAGPGRAQSALISMRAYYTLETGELDGLPRSLESATGAGATTASAVLALGSLAIRHGRIDEARTLLARLRAGSGAAGGGMEMSHPGMTTASSSGAHAPREVEIMGQELEAMCLRAEGKPDQALQLLKSAATAEDGLSFEFGPPVPSKPTHELLGEMLLAEGRAKEARAEFERALAKYPKRTLSLRGLAQSATQAGDTAAADRARNDLKSFWRGEAL
jgi:tetratricopeptide (TPR) repeat protein